MSTHGLIDAVCILIAILGIIVTILFMNGEKIGINTIINKDAEEYDETDNVTDSDINGGWDSSRANTIIMQGNDGTIVGSGAYFYNGDLIVGKSGDYIISGALNDGSIVIDADKKAQIKILLNGISVSCNDGPAIIVKKADKVIITLADNTTNIVSTGEEFSKEAKKEKYEGTIYSKDDLTINGNGSLSVNAPNKHGIHCKDSLVIAGGNIDLSARKDAIHSKKSISIVNSLLSITAGDDAIVSKKDVSLENSNINIFDCYEGIEGKTVNIYSGEINIKTRDDGINARVEGTKLSNDASINIMGGTIIIENNTSSDADGLDSNGDIVISGGNIFISLSNFGTNNAIDYGSECGGICTITGGVVLACGSYAMAEGFDKLSTQPSILYGYSKAAKDETVVTLKDENGHVILSKLVPYSFSSISLSTPELKLGYNYKLIIGNDEADITISEMAASYGDVQSEKMHGGFNKGNTKPYEGNPIHGDKFREGDEFAPDRRPEGKMPIDEMELNKDHSDRRPEIPEDIQAVRDDFNRNVSVNVIDLPEEAEEEFSEWIDIKDISTETWFMLMTSFGVIIFGIIVAAEFKRR